MIMTEFAAGASGLLVAAQHDGPAGLRPTGVKVPQACSPYAAKRNAGPAIPDFALRFIRPRLLADVGWAKARKRRAHQHLINKELVGSLRLAHPTLANGCYARFVPLQITLPHISLGHSTTTGRSARRRALSVAPSSRYRCMDCIGLSERRTSIDRPSTSTRRPVNRGWSSVFRPNLDGPKSSKPCRLGGNGRLLGRWRKKPQMSKSLTPPSRSFRTARSGST